MINIQKILHNFLNALHTEKTETEAMKKILASTEKEFTEMRKSIKCYASKAAMKSNLDLLTQFVDNFVNKGSQELATFNVNLKNEI